MNLFLEAYYELFPENKSNTVYFFFEEIQVIKDWEIFVRRVYDNENCKIFITGSSSKLMVKELSTALRGRSLIYEIFPLSFKKYLNFKEVEINLYSSRSIAKIKNGFNHYVSSTSFPELIDYNDHLKTKALSEYLNLTIYKDVAERYGVSNLFCLNI